VNGPERAAAASAACLDDERLAAYVDGRLDPAERSAVEVHLAGCRRCREVAAETAAFLRAETRAGLTPSHRAKWPIAVVVAASLAATVVLVVRLGFVASQEPATASRPELAELVAAAAHEPTRLAEGRLTGGFAYKPAPVATRGPADRSPSPELKIVSAKLEQEARRHETAASDAALGTSYLALGNFDEAVDRLETAVQERPDDARYQNDLSVAYIARAIASGRADDWPKALAAAERAAARDPRLVEPCFNRALALEGMTLASDAADAWTACAEADLKSPWAAEARSRAEAIRKRLNDPASKPHSLQIDREEIEDRLLVSWAEAEQRGDHPSADDVLTRADTLAHALAEHGGDTMPVDEIALIRRTPRGSQVRTALVTAHQAYGRARAAFVREALSDARDEMSAAAQWFAKADSPYKYWAPIFRAIPLWIERSADASLRELASIPIDRLPSSYYHLRGRVAWTEAMAFEVVGAFDRARSKLEVARDLFRRAGELEYESVNTFYLAEAERFLGNRQRLWQLEFDAIRHVDDLPSGPRQGAILWNGAIVASREGLPEAGLALVHHLLHLSNRDAATSGQYDDPNTYLRRGELFERLNNINAAMADFARAETAAVRMPDRRLRNWMTAEIHAARSEALVTRDPSAAVAAADAALAFQRQGGGPVRQSELLLIRARARETLGDFVAAAADYDAAMSAVEHDEDTVTVPDKRKAAFDQQRTAIGEAVRFAAVVRHDPDAAVAIAERGRARVLRQTFAGSPVDALNPMHAHRSLPDDVAVLYYATLSDRILAWLFTKTDSVHYTVPIDPARLGLTVRRLYRRIAADADLRDVSAELRALQPLIQPALSRIPRDSTVVVVPDMGLARIPFAALADEHGAPLITRHPILFAPSFTTFVLASGRLTGFAPDGVVAIGDGHDAAATGLPRLPRADTEVTEVSRLYPHASAYTGGQATVHNFLAAGQPVIHFAGHTIANPEFPSLSRLLFAPDPVSADRSGVLLASEVSRHRFGKTAVVVLASCESAAGQFILGEGFDSVARMFLDAGVPSVVASLWQVEDEYPMMVEFHRQLRLTNDSARALRAAQLDGVAGRGTNRPLRQWAGFVAVGGTNVIRFREGRIHD
jgi:CHAT domain-containing protein